MKLKVVPKIFPFRWHSSLNKPNIWLFLKIIKELNMEDILCSMKQHWQVCTSTSASTSTISPNQKQIVKFYQIILNLRPSNLYKIPVLHSNKLIHLFAKKPHLICPKRDLRFFRGLKTIFGHICLFFFFSQLHLNIDSY